MRRMLGPIGRSVLLAAALCTGVAGCGDKPSKSDCAKLLDNFIKIRVNAELGDKPSDDAKKELKKQKAAVKEQIQKKFMTQCVDRTPTGVVKCGLRAQSIEDLAKCEK